jgi:uncharacterized protein YkwD
MGRFLSAIAALVVMLAATPALAIYTGVAISGGNAQEISTMTITLPGKAPIPVRKSRTDDERKVGAWFIDAPYRPGIGDTATVTVTDEDGKTRSAMITMGVTEYSINLNALFGPHTPVENMTTGIPPVVNFARTQPTAYAATLPGPGDPAEIREAITFVINQQPENPLTESAALDTAAARHAADLGAHGLTGHIGSDGSSPADRIHAAGVFSSIVDEEVAFGQITAEAVVRKWVMDHGLPQRPHRNDLYHAVLALLGVGCAPHETMGTVCVLDMTSAPIGTAPSAPPACTGAGCGAAAYDCGGVFYDAKGAVATPPRSPHSESSEQTLKAWKQEVESFYNSVYTSPSGPRLSPGKAELCSEWRAAREARADETIAKDLELLWKESFAPPH